LDLIEPLISQCWYASRPSCGIVRWLLAPFSMLFAFLVVLRRWLYRVGWKKSTRLPVPVVVVGNITAGGAGKTPLTLALVDWLQAAGYHPGIVSRGYGGNARRAMPVQSGSDAAVVGDEPLLLAQRSGCPVWIGRRRVEAAQQLLAYHPEVDVLVADDGLQHYALARDMEIVVVDAGRGVGNAWPLPAGPLREPLRRLGKATAMVLNGPGQWTHPVLVPMFRMELQAALFHNLLAPDRRMTVPAFIAETSGPVHALAGIGHPQRFFDQLARLGLEVVSQGFPDHHAFQMSDLPPGRVVMTEKDAVKVAPLARNQGLTDYWYLSVDARVEPGLKEMMLSLMNKDRGGHGPQAA